MESNHAIRAPFAPVVWVVPSRPDRPVRATVRVYLSHDWRGRETVRLLLRNTRRKPLPPTRLELTTVLGTAPGGVDVTDPDTIYPLVHDSDTAVSAGAGYCYVLQGEVFAAIRPQVMALSPDDTWCRLIARQQEIGRVPVRGLQILLRGVS